MVETILISCKLIQMHSHDFLDQRIIEFGGFVPNYTEGSLKIAITEII